MFEEKHPVWSRTRVGKARVHWVAYDDRPGVEGRLVVAQGYAASLPEADAAARAALAGLGMHRSRRASTGFGRAPAKRDEAKVDPPANAEARPKPTRPERPREYLYTRQHSDEANAPSVAAHLVVRRTPRKVYVSRKACGPDQLGTADERWAEDERTIPLDRARLEAEGSVYSSAHRLSDFYPTREAALGDAEPDGPSPFRALGLRAPCTLDEIKSAYRRKAFEVHPDRGGTPADFHAVEAAYRRLLREAQVSDL